FIAVAGVPGQDIKNDQQKFPVAKKSLTSTTALSMPTTAVSETVLAAATGVLMLMRAMAAFKLMFSIFAATIVHMIPLFATPIMLI
ncbi:hypothetical protein AIZ20_23600, partial [Salmonella enterica subsp. enterica serovar Typhimurium]